MNYYPTFDFSNANISRGQQDIQWWNLNDSAEISATSRRTIPRQNLNMSAWSIDFNEIDQAECYDENNMPTSPISSFTDRSGVVKLSMAQDITDNLNLSSMNTTLAQKHKDDPFLKPFWKMELGTFVYQF
jgi:hypothetical protein